MQKRNNIAILIVWLIVIFMFSNQGGETSTITSNNVSKNILSVYEKISSKMYSKEEKEKIIESSITVVRKTAHVFEYFILGLLLINALKDYRKFDYRLLIYSIILCFICAFFDEFHQLFIPNRTGRVVDTFIDSIGFISSTVIYYFLYSKLKKRNRLNS